MSIHFVTGRLAEHSLCRVLETLAPEAGFDYTIQVMNITVAALMSPEWIAARIEVPPGTSRILVPGYCEGDLAPIVRKANVPVERGPRDLRRLPEFFGRREARSEYGGYDIELLAEINNVSRLALPDVLAEAARLTQSGADLIDVGCTPGEPFVGVGDVVRALREAGHRVSIDSLDPREIEPAVHAGAELVLSVNSSNRAAAADWGCEVVVIPDVPETLEGLDETVAFLAERGVPLRIDPVLSPIGFGFSSSLSRYLEIRRRYPDAEMMMGIGNLTELTDVDSAGVNVLLLGFCQEIGIHSVLTTQVINWARTSVRECDLARRLVFHAARNRVLPKHVEPRLVMLRDERLDEYGDDELDRLAREIKDHDVRLFAEGGKLHVVAAGLHLAERDPFLLFERLMATRPTNVDPGHAFYLGYELSKALTALSLGKQYQQDEALDWGFLTEREDFHRLRRKRTRDGDAK